MKNSTYTNIVNNEKPLTIQDLDKATELLMVQPEQDKLAGVRQFEYWRTYFGLKVIPQIKQPLIKTS